MDELGYSLRFEVKPKFEDRERSMCLEALAI
jgi:hypothetical protein